MANQSNNIMILDDAGFARTIDTSNDSLTIGVETTFSNDLTVQGDLQIQGDIVSGGQVDVVTEDAFIDLRINSASDGSAGLTAQIEMANAVRFNLKQARAEFIAGTGNNNPKIQLTGEYTNAIGTQGKSRKIIEFTGVPTASSTLQINDGFVQRTYTFKTVGPFGVFDVDVSSAGDGPAAATAFKNAVDANQSVAGNELLLQTGISGAEVTLTSQLDSESITLVQGGNVNASIRDVLRSSALGAQAEGTFTITDMASFDNGSPLRLVIGDGGSNNLTIDGGGTDFTKQGSITATIDAMYNAIFAKLVATANFRFFLLDKTADSLIIRSAKGGTGGNAYTLSVSNNGGGSAISGPNLAGGQDWLLQHDIIAISGLVDGAENNGLFKVDSQPSYSAPNTEIEISRVLSTQAPFCQTQFEAYGPLDPNAAGEDGVLANNIGLSILLASDGAVQDAAGATIPKGNYTQAFAINPNANSSNNGRQKITYESFGNVSLQEAYDVGASIATDASGPITFNLSANNQGFDVFGGSAGTGNVRVGVGGNTVNDVGFGAAGTFSVDAAGGISLDSSAGNINIDTVDGTARLGAAGNGNNVTIASALSDVNILAQDSTNGDIGITAGMSVTVTSGSGASKGISLTDGTGSLRLGVGAGNAAKFSDNAMTHYNFAPSTLFDVESAAITMGTEATAATTFTFGEGSNANTFTVDAGTSSIGMVAGTTVTLAAGTDLSGTAEQDLLLKVDGQNGDSNDRFLSIHAVHADAAQTATILLGSDDAGAGSDQLAICADINIVGKGKAASGNLYDSANRSPLGIMMKAGTGGVGVGDIIAIEGNVAGGNAGLKANNANTDQYERFGVGVALQTAAATNPFAMATVPGTVANVRFSAAAGQASIGSPVYCAGGANAGQGTLTAPTAPGTTVFQIGILLDNADLDSGPGTLHAVLLQPRFVAKRP